MVTHSPCRGRNNSGKLSAGCKLLQTHRSPSTNRLFRGTFPSLLRSRFVVDRVPFLTSLLPSSVSFLPAALSSSRSLARTSLFRLCSSLFSPSLFSLLGSTGRTRPLFPFCSFRVLRPCRPSTMHEHHGLSRDALFARSRRDTAPKRGSTRVDVYRELRNDLETITESYLRVGATAKQRRAMPRLISFVFGG